MEIDELAEHFIKMDYIPYCTYANRKGDFEISFINSNSPRYHNEPLNEIRFSDRSKNYCVYWHMPIDNIVSVYAVNNRPSEAYCECNAEQYYKCMFYNDIGNGIKQIETISIDKESANILISLINVISSGKTQYLINAINKKYKKYYKETISEYMEKLKHVVELIDVSDENNDELVNTAGVCYDNCNFIKLTLDQLKTYFQN